MRPAKDAPRGGGAHRLAWAAAGAALLMCAAGAALRGSGIAPPTAWAPIAYALPLVAHHVGPALRRPPMSWPIDDPGATGAPDPLRSPSWRSTGAAGQAAARELGRYQDALDTTAWAPAPATVGYYLNRAVLSLHAFPPLLLAAWHAWDALRSLAAVAAALDAAALVANGIASAYIPVARGLLARSAALGAIPCSAALALGAPPPAAPAIAALAAWAAVCLVLARMDSTFMGRARARLEASTDDQRRQDLLVLDIEGVWAPLADPTSTTRR